MEKKRDSRFELLRILCMLGITVHHFIYHSSIMESAMGINRLLAQFFLIFGKFGVNIFVLISGYYLSSNQETHLKKSRHRVFNLYKQVLLYSILCMGIGAAVFEQSIGAGKIIKAFFPIITESYWYVTAFVGLMILEPFLNVFVHSLTKEMYGYLILILIAILALIPMNVWCNNLLWFMFLYITAAYIRIYQEDFKWKKKSWLLTGITCMIIMWAASIMISIAAHKISALENYINYFAMRQNTIFMYAASVSIFIFVVKSRSFVNENINQMAKHILPCYLIQSNIFLSEGLWKAADQVIDYSSGFYILYILAGSCILMLFFMAVDIAISYGTKMIRNRYKERRKT